MQAKKHLTYFRLVCPALLGFLVLVRLTGCCPEYGYDEGARATEKPVNARLIFDPVDAALSGATVVPLDASIGMFLGAQNLVYVEPTTGVEFEFSSASPLGFFSTAIFGSPAFVAVPPDGVTISIDPPVSAIGFHYEFAECFGNWRTYRWRCCA